MSSFSTLPCSSNIITTFTSSFDVKLLYITLLLQHNNNMSWWRKVSFMVSICGADGRCPALMSYLVTTYWWGMVSCQASTCDADGRCPVWCPVWSQHTVLIEGVLSGVNIRYWWKVTCLVSCLESTYSADVRCHVGCPVWCLHTVLMEGVMSGVNMWCWWKMLKEDGSGLVSTCGAESYLTLTSGANGRWAHY